MNNREAAIITAFTGITFGKKHFLYFHEYAEEKFCRPIFTHEMASKEFWSELKELARSDLEDLAAKLE